MKKTLLLAFLGIIVLFTLRPVGDFDTGYHLKTGQYIFENRTVPRYDIFSYAAPGSRWIAHYWLSDVVFYLWYQVGELWGLIIGVALAAALTYFIILKTAWLRVTSFFFPLLLVIPFGALTFELWVVRPQIFSYLWAALLIYLLERWRLRADTHSLSFIPLIMLLWANMHAGVILGIIIIIFYAADAAFRKDWKGLGERDVFALFGFSVLLTLANPNGWRTLAYARIIAPSAELLRIEEWRPFIEFLETPQAILFLILMIVSVLFAYFRILPRKSFASEFRLVDITLITLAFLMPMVSIRHVGFFPLLAFPVVAGELATISERMKRPFDAYTIVPLLAAVLAAILAATQIARVYTLQPLNRHLLPEGAVRFIESNSIRGPLFNHPAQGGWLIWKLWPREKVFMDGRSEVYRGDPERDFLVIMRGESNWKKLIEEKYRFRGALLWYREPLAELPKRLYAALTKELEFVLVHWDDAGVLLLRDSPENRDVIEKFGYRIISPFLDPYTVPAEKRPALASEFERAVAAAPESVVLRNFLNR